MFVKAENTIKLHMSVEEGARMILSAGLVVPEHPDVQAAIDAMMGQVTGGNRNNMDFLAWYIDPGDGSAASPAAAGFAPHRDRQPRDIAASFKEGGEPKYLTCWLPFTDASPENSCLYVIPKSADPSYMAGCAPDHARATAAGLLAQPLCSLPS